MFEIGKSLHDARMRRGLDIADCERATKVRGKYLRALEEEEFGMLPDPAYVKGFLRAYGEFLDVDPQLLLDEYASRFEPEPEPHHEIHPLPPRRGNGGGGASRRNVAPLSSAPRPPRRRPGSRRGRGLPLLLLAVGAAVAVIAIVWLGSRGSGADAQRPVLLGADSTPARLAVTGTGPGGSFLEVRRAGAQGQVLYRGTVRDGEQRAFRSTGRLWMRLGAAQNVQLRVNGHQIAPPGSGSTFVVTGQDIAPATGT